MARTTTIVELEPSDIHWTKDDPDRDPVHEFLAANVVVMLLTDIRPQPGENQVDVINRLVAKTLNHAARSGITITKSEIPAAITAAFKAGAES